MTPSDPSDLISRSVLLAEAKRLSGPQTGDGWDNWGVYALIERQPAVVRPNGTWVDTNYTQWPANKIRTCSECGWHIHMNHLRNSDLHWKYCPNCGNPKDGVQRADNRP